jgi:hypothetical protein
MRARLHIPLTDSVLIALVIAGTLIITVAGYAIYDHPLAIGVYLGAAVGVLSWLRRHPSATS